MFTVNIGFIFLIINFFSRNAKKQGDSPPLENPPKTVYGAASPLPIATATQHPPVLMSLIRNCAVVFPW